MIDDPEEEMSEEEKAAAAAWEGMADEAVEDSPAATGPMSNRVLDQDEIDSLLGIAKGGDGDEKQSGIQAMLNSALVSYERLPMLEIIFDRLVRMLSTSLRNFTTDNVEVSLDNITAIRFGDYLNSIPLPAMMGVFKAEEWDNYGLLMVDSSLTYSIVDVLLGGRRGTAAMRIEGRPYTTIERNLVERLINVVLNDLTATFDVISPVTFRFERLETNPRFAAIARPANAAILARLRVDMEDRGGRLELMLPYATLQMFMGEKFGRDSIWETHLSGELWQTEVKINAVLDEVQVSLNDVLNWKPGSRLDLEVTPESLVELRCGDVQLFRGQMGRKGHNIAVKIQDRLIK